MGLKSGMPSLEGLPGLGEAQRAKLEERGVTTLAELAGELEAATEALRRDLGMSPEEVSDLHARVLVALPPETRAAMDTARQRPPLGARKPPHIR
jgi:predicted RecB family nuclease